MILTLIVAFAVALSCIAFVAIAWDKRCAEQKRWRVPEATLHLFELLGGWPGSWLGQRYFRHKTSKPRYRVVFWICAALNVALIAATLTVAARLDR